MTDIRGKNLRYTIKAIIDIPAKEPESITEYLEHLQEVGAAAVMAVEVVDADEPIPYLEEEYDICNTTKVRTDTQINEL